MRGSSSSLNHSFSSEAGTWGSRKVSKGSLPLSICSLRPLTSSMSPGTLWMEVKNNRKANHHLPPLYSWTDSSGQLMRIHTRFNLWTCNREKYHHQLQDILPQILKASKGPVVAMGWEAPCYFACCGWSSYGVKSLPKYPLEETHWLH